MNQNLSTHQQHLDTLRQQNAPHDLIESYKQWIEAGHNLAFPEDEQRWRKQGQNLLERVLNELKRERKSDERI